ncbi:MAG: hypothetical protein DWQ36_10260 [Acidobacteria bacterium]|nr:MAG: hypothetical protein DWQ30_02985 [Acidobacteriota bacterium]REK08433.1 MAG: hypothetical protein DWQ36_10260 [Acidobacteriota bacterium]
MLVAATGLLVASAASAANLIFRDGFEFGVTRWSSVVPPQASSVVWSNETEVPVTEFLHCDLPPGVYTIRVLVEGDYGSAVKEIAMTITEAPCLSGIGICRFLAFTDLP